MLPDDLPFKIFASPRRFAVLVRAVLKQGRDIHEQRKLMPTSVGLDAAGQATPALLKKLATLGMGAEVVPQLRREGEGKAESLVYDSKQSGAMLTDGLQQALQETLTKLPIPKMMTYQLADGWSDVQFVRPAHRLGGAVRRRHCTNFNIGFAGWTYYPRPIASKRQARRWKFAMPTATKRKWKMKAR